MGKKCLFFGVLLSVWMSGCVSNAEYKELEERVANLEKVIGVYESKDTSESDAKKDELVVDKVGKEDFTYIIDELSEQEIVAECQYYFGFKLEQGASYEDYFATMKAEPVWKNNDGNAECMFYNTSPYDNSSHDTINWIKLCGIQTEMDGSIGYRDAYYSVWINMTIQDYERAASIYSGLYDAMVNEYYEDITDNRQSTRWEARTIYKITDLQRVMIDFLQMSKEANGYNIVISYPVRRE